jgi:hypothetical protein
VRGQAYWLFALVAWPAAVWGAIETILRVAASYGDGIGGSLALTACAAATILGCAWRKRALAEASINAPR